VTTHDHANRQGEIGSWTGRMLAPVSWPVRRVVAALDFVVVTLDESPATNAGSLRLRQGSALLMIVFAGLLIVQGALHRKLSPMGFILGMLAFALYTNRGGRFLRDWVPVALAFVAYAATARAVPDLGLGVHYTPQIHAERVLGFGSLPTIWLQEHLYHGKTGALEIFSIAMYISHFLAPLLLAFLIWAFWQGRGFRDLLYGILIVSLLGEITFVLAPTAPPWLAADHGLIPPVHHVIKQGLYDLGLTDLAARKDEPGSYNIVAALPSLHAAWPMIGLLVIRKHKLPRWLLLGQGLLLLGVVFAIVYTGEHYLVDAVVGCAYAFGAWWLLHAALRTGRRHQDP
jgi:PAP2 superfamily protein